MLPPLLHHIAVYLTAVVLSHLPLHLPPASNWKATPHLLSTRSLQNKPTGYTPTQIRHAYGFDQISKDGNGQLIAIITAYDNPSLAQDMSRFISTFGLKSMHGISDSCTVATGPHPCLQKTFPQGKPSVNTDWNMESALDAEWSHTIAPGADIIVVEAKSSSLTNLLDAVDLANKMHPSVVSMSWGGPEFLGVQLYAGHFNQPGTSYVAASGDTGVGVQFPATLSQVIAVGGTTVQLDPQGTRRWPEIAWRGSGGGVSAYVKAPDYQLALSGKRGVPDVAYNADPATGYAVISQDQWYLVGGTSASAPQWAALLALASQNRAASSPNMNIALYRAGAKENYNHNFLDITSGRNGVCGNNCTAKTGYDFVTGLGSPIAQNLIPFLNSH